MPAVALRSLWSATASPGPDCSALSTPRRAQAVVIGAGYTGLSAALHLAQAGRDVVVLESAQIGACASGVNGGQVIPGVKHDPDTLEAMFGPVLGARLIDTVAAGPAVLFELDRTPGHRLRCHPDRVDPAGDFRDHAAAARRAGAAVAAAWRGRRTAIARAGCAAHRFHPLLRWPVGPPRRQRTAAVLCARTGAGGAARRGADIHAQPRAAPESRCQRLLPRRRRPPKSLRRSSSSRPTPTPAV